MSADEEWIDLMTGLRAQADQVREGLREIASLVAAFYLALVAAGTPPQLAAAVARDWHRSTFLVTPLDEEAPDPDRD